MNSNSPNQPRGWHKRGYLPHFDAGHTFNQSITYRLADSLPQFLLQQWQEELSALSPEAFRSELSLKIDSYCDAGHGECFLRDDRIAQLVQNGFLHFDEKRYLLHTCVVMPNHVHVVITPLGNESLSDIIHSWKSFTSHQSNKLLGRNGEFWQADYFDRYIRDETHFHQAIEYVENNTVRAGLCARPEDWKWSSAFWNAAVPAARKRSAAVPAARKKERGRPGRS